MDNERLDDLLREKFSGMQEARVTGTIAPDVMHRLAVLEAETRLPREWVIGFALLLGALVCVPSLQGLDFLSLFGVQDWLAPFSAISAFDWKPVISSVGDLVVSFAWVLLLIPCGLLLLADY